MERIVKPIETEYCQFQELFNQSLTSSNGLVQQVLDYVKHTTGKQMRPILVLLLAKLFGKITPSAMHAAISLELLHTASLIHDDVVDESAERRGRPSVNDVFNNKVSVLSGDFLLGLSLQHAALSGSLDIVRIVADLGKDLSEGEILQLENIQSTEFSEAIYFEVIRKKTAALFRASAMCAAIASDANAETVRRAGEFGELLGIAFQIKDDIFDYFDSADIGKPTGNDMHEGKLTLPALYTIHHTDQESLRDMAGKIKKGLASDAEIHEFIACVKQGGGIAYAESVMDDYRSRALNLLSETDSEVHAAVIRYIDFVINRTK